MNFQKDVSLAQYTTFKVGGPAKYFFAAESSDDLIKAVQEAKNKEIPYFILGAGSNLLVSDKGFDGLVIQIKDSRLKIEGTKVVAGAGVRNAELAKATVDAGLTGLEWIVGIPGTVGGSVRGNAGAYGGEMKDVVRTVKVIGDGLEEMSGAECEFAYRDSIFKHDSDLIIVEVSMELEKGGGEEKLKEILKKRSDKQPKGLSSGCVFKNYELQGGEDKFPQEFVEKGIIPAGWIIDQLGLKGFQIGKAQISLEHGNFIINTGGATAEDVIMLISLIKQKSRNHFGIQLEEEIQLVGF